jgi:hypothetical protein
MIALRAEGIGLDGALEEDYQVQYRVSALFTVSEGTSTLYREEEFPVAELANELFGWLADDKADSSIEFSSVFSDEQGLVCITATPDGRWTFGSLAEGARTSKPVDHQEMMAALNDFVAKVDDWCVEHAGVSIRQKFRS